MWLTQTGEVAACREVAQARGILLDPIYTLAAWQASQALLSGRELGCSRDGGAAHQLAECGTSAGQRLLRACSVSATGHWWGGLKTQGAQDGVASDAQAGSNSSSASFAPTPRVVMLHTGGTLGLFGLAQSSKKYAAEMAGVRSSEGRPGGR